eukprot:2755329-Rhodomonas_salina.1
MRPKSRGICLRPCYAMSGTDTADGSRATRDARTGIVCGCLPTLVLRDIRLNQAYRELNAKSKQDEAEIARYLPTAVLRDARYWHSVRVSAYVRAMRCPERNLTNHHDRVAFQKTQESTVCTLLLLSLMHRHLWA